MVGSPTLGLDPPLLVPFVEGALSRALGSSTAVSLDLSEAKALSGGLLGPGTELPIVDLVRRQPLAFRQIDGLLQAPGGEETPIADRIRQAARLLDAEAPPVAIGGSYEEALARLCNPSCGTAEGSIPEALATALAPILMGAAEVAEAIRARDRQDPRTAEWWFEHGASALLATEEASPPNPSDPGDRAYLLGGRSALYAAAASLVEAVERAQLERFAWTRSHYRLETPLGVIRIGGAENSRYPANPEPILLLLELGGDDLYLDRVGANKSADNPVSILIDLGGDDRYSYPEAEGEEDDRLPADAYGRGSRPDVYNRASLSQAGRQASARGGVALLFDYQGDDRYVALQGSQAYADQGVAVLADLEGDDQYLAEGISQGAAQSGIALLYDRSGNDRYQASARAQGFGFVAGLGALDDLAGDDRYLCTPDAGVYPSLQDPSLSASLCQGAALGLRSGSPLTALGGGLGLLRDEAGDDRYQAGVFGQGVGYFGGLGALLDRAGDDRLNVAWYGAGAGLHFGVGLYFDGAGADQLDADGAPKHLLLGSGHDFGLGIAVDQSGDDERHLASLSGGAASAGGLGIFVDAQGDDRTEAKSNLVLGAVSVGGSFPDLPTVGLYFDAGGDDRYPEQHPGAQNQGYWAGELQGEDGLGLAGGVDGQAELGPDLGLVTEP